MPHDWSPGRRRSCPKKILKCCARRTESPQREHLVTNLGTTSNFHGARHKRCSLRHGCAGLACAHHRDDQAEYEEKKLGLLLARMLRPQPSACRGGRRSPPKMHDVKHQPATHKRNGLQLKQAQLEHCRQRALEAAAYRACGWSSASASATAITCLRERRQLESIVVVVCWTI